MSHDPMSKTCCMFNALQNASIMGHSMGGHGALVIGLRNPTKYKSISALAPIAHPIDSPWGQKGGDPILHMWAVCSGSAC